MSAMNDCPPMPWGHLQSGVGPGWHDMMAGVSAMCAARKTRRDAKREAPPEKVWGNGGPPCYTDPNGQLRYNDGRGENGDSYVPEP